MSQEEMFNWNPLLYPVSQLFNIVPEWFELSCSQETQCFKIFNNIQISTMSSRISRLLCFTSTQKQSTWNTKRIWSEQYWCGGNSGRCGQSKVEKWMGILQTLFDRYWNGKWKTQSLQLCHVILRHFFGQRWNGLCIQRTEMCCKS